MDAILKKCGVEREPGMKLAEKAALIVQKVPQDSLPSFLATADAEAPVMRKSRAEPILPSGRQ